MIDIKKEQNSILNILNILYDMDNNLYDKDKDKYLSRDELLNRYLMLVKILNYKIKNIEIAKKIEGMDKEGDVMIKELVNILLTLTDEEKEKLREFLIKLKKEKINKVIYD